MRQTPEWFLSCDWGTSFFQLRLVQTDLLITVADESSAQGIANVFKSWQQQPGVDRLSFYQAVIQKHIVLLEQQSNRSLEHVPVIVSGMASATIGMIEVAYKEVPFYVDGSDLIVNKIEATDAFCHDIFLISGVRTDSDVMRGEETQVVGCTAVGALEERMVILPGTHSKHIILKGNQAVAFRTYMTGEFFELLSQKSILSASVEQGDGFKDERNRQSFEAGVANSKRADLLHNCFEVRTNILFQKMDRQQNYYYLSGLLIGTELRNLADGPCLPITLVSNEALQPFYVEALRLILPGNDLTVKSVEEALVKGQFRVYSSFIKRP